MNEPKQPRIVKPCKDGRIIVEGMGVYAPVAHLEAKEAENTQLRETAATLEQDGLEQARLNGMGAERELSLQQELNQAKAILKNIHTIIQLDHSASRFSEICDVMASSYSPEEKEESGH